MALTGEQIDKLRGTIFSLGWQEVVKPVLANSGKVAMDMLLDPAIKRDGEYSGATDDSLRGTIKAYKSVLAFFENEVRAFDQNKAIDDALRKAETAQGQGSPYADQSTNGN